MKPAARLRRGLVLAVAGLALAAPGCATYSEDMARFRAAWYAGEFAAADLEVNRQIAEESGEALDTITRSGGLADSIDPNSGDTDLLLLEKAIVRLARDDAEGSIGLLRRARESFDGKFVSSLPASFWSEFKAQLSDDTALPYTGWDYEHILIRVFLALADLVTGGADAYSFALQIGEKQEEIIGSPYEFAQSRGGGGSDGEDSRRPYRPRAEYRRIALGAYLEGIIQEAALEADVAERSFTRAREYFGSSRLLDEAVERARSGIYAPPGHGVVHVFYLAGRGPTMVESQAPPGTELASRIAGIGLGIGLDSWSAAMQAPVPVPWVQVLDSRPRPLEIRVDGSEATFRTRTILDVNEVAREQHRANLPVIVARAVVRRTLKAAAVGTGEHFAARGFDSAGAGGASRLIAFLIGAIINLAWTGSERADTRHWSALPAEVQVARIAVEVGTRELDLGDGMRIRVRVQAAEDTFVLVVRPQLSRPGAVIADHASRRVGGGREPGPPGASSPAEAP